MELPFELVRKSFDALMGGLEDSGRSSPTVDGDYYWSVDPLVAISPYERPELTLGSLSDALDELQRLADGSAGAVPHHLVWLGDVLRALGATIDAAELTPRGDEGPSA